LRTTGLGLRTTGLGLRTTGLGLGLWCLMPLTTIFRTVLVNQNKMCESILHYTIYNMLHLLQ